MPSYGSRQKRKVSLIWGLIQFWEPLCFLLIAWPILIRKLIFWGWCFGIIRISSWWWAQSEILKIDAEKFEVEAGNPHLESDRKMISVLKVQLKLQFSEPLLHFQNSCAHHQEEIVRIPKQPQISTFWWVWAKKIAIN